MRGLYIHIPFCVRKCSYCDFYSLPTHLDYLESYLCAVVRESQAYRGLSCQTLYLGGGTPSLLGGNHLRNLIGGIGKSLDISELVEATIEVNPESVSGELLLAAKDAGINRVSIGVQSLADNELKSVGRIHNSLQATEAIKLTKKLGFKSVSADLLIGLPGQTWLSLRNTLEKLTGIGIQHLSAYCLSLEESTPLAKSPPPDLPSDDMQADFFERANSFLSERGFLHYEISNFALKGHECRHNLNYWHGGEYLGLGPSAASHLNGRRFRNGADLNSYLEKPTDLIEENEELNMENKVAEEAMLRLRLLMEGIEINELTARFGHDSSGALVSRLNCLVDEGQLVFDGSSYRLAPSRILTSNPIFARVLFS